MRPLILLIKEKLSALEASSGPLFVTRKITINKNNNGNSLTDVLFSFYKKIDFLKIVLKEVSPVTVESCRGVLYGIIVSSEI